MSKRGEAILKQTRAYLDRMEELGKPAPSEIAVLPTQLRELGKMGVKREDGSVVVGSLVFRGHEQ